MAQNAGARDNSVPWFIGDTLKDAVDNAIGVFRKAEDIKQVAKLFEE